MNFVFSHRHRHLFAEHLDICGFRPELLKEGIALLEKYSLTIDDLKNIGINTFPILA